MTLMFLVEGYWSFVEKTSVMQDLKCKVCSNFQITFLHLVRVTFFSDLWLRLIFEPPGSGFSSDWHLVTLWVGLTSGQLYPPRMRLQVRLTFIHTFGHADLWSDVPPGIDILWSSVLLLWSDWPLIRWTLPAETSCVQVCYNFSQADLWSDVPPGRDILWSSMLLVWSGWLLARCIPW